MMPPVRLEPIVALGESVEEERIAMYDIHTHILPGVDDGARSLEETENMLQQEWQQGVRHIIATPHYAAGDTQSPEKLRLLLESVRETARKMDPEMTVDLGNELLHGPGMIESLQRGEALTLAGTRYVLVEFLPTERYSVIYQALRSYIMEGYLPVVAHVERYETLISHWNHMEETRRLGAYFQVNAGSLIGGFFQRRAAACRRLVEEGMISLIGSDCHREDRRVPVMRDALAYLSRNFRESEDFWKLVRGNPQALLTDQFI